MTSIVAGVVVFVTLTALSVPLRLRGPMGGDGRLSPYDRRGSGGHTDRCFCAAAFLCGCGDHSSCLPGLYRDGKPRPEPDNNEPDGEGKPSRRPSCRSGRAELGDWGGAGRSCRGCLVSRALGQRALQVMAEELWRALLTTTTTRTGPPIIMGDEGELPCSDGRSPWAIGAGVRAPHRALYRYVRRGPRRTPLALLC